MKILLGMKRLIKKINGIRDDLEFIKVSLGRIEYRQTEHLMNPDKAEFKVFSQWGEDGIIQWLIHNLNIESRTFIEFGVQNYTESNTRFLLMNDNWSGLVIDGSAENIGFIKRDNIYWRYNLKAECAFITAENINELISKNGLIGEIGILSVDIDGNDYWVWKAIDVVNPAIVICEYNYRFGKDKAVTIPYDPSFVREKAHYSNIYYGPSIQALVQLGNEKGYSLVAGNRNGNNVFFVRNDLLNEKVSTQKVDKVYTVGHFRESRNSNGELTYLSVEEEKELLAKLKFVNV